MKVENISSRFRMIITIIFIAFGGSTVAEECLKGGKTMEFNSNVKWFPVDSEYTDITLNCLVNKPANITVYFYQDQLPIDAKRPTALVTSRKIDVKTNNCSLRINLKKERSICNSGEYVCIATDATGGLLGQESLRVTGMSTPNSKFRFLVEDVKLQENKELIIGTRANLSCTIHSAKKWLLDQPFIEFGKKNAQGTVSRIPESYEVPKRYEWSRQVYEKGCVGICDGTRKLFIRRIDESDSGNYSCKVKLRYESCSIEKFLFLNARPCKAGYHCHANSSDEVACPSGTYSSVTGLFDASGCRDCPVDSYCPKASSTPFKCPRSSFLASRKTDIKILTGKREKKDCRICPVQPCDKNGEKCTMICAKHALVEAVIGRPVSIDCKFSDTSILRNLTWIRNNKTLTNDGFYSLIQSSDTFTLRINQTTKEHAGDYICTATEIIMGNQVKSGSRLVVLTKANNEKSSNGEIDAFTVTSSVVSVTILLLFMLVAFLFGARYRRRQKLSKKRPSKTSKEFMTDLQIESFPPDSRSLFTRFPSLDTDTDHEFDVFICYSSADKLWVRKTLLPTLQGNNLRVCIDFQDFSPGEFIIANIADAIAKSRKTIAVLSPDFVGSEWCKTELQMALTRIQDKHQVIPVLYRECAVPRFLLHRTYLDWCNDDVKQTFWQQLLKKITDDKDISLKDDTVEMKSTK